MLSTRTVLAVALIAFCLVSGVVGKKDEDDYKVGGDHDADDFDEYVACESDANLPYISYVNFLASPEPGAAANSGRVVSARLKVPKFNSTLPAKPSAAVLIVHGSAGLDTRGELYSYNLNQKGIITLEIDLWAARGWYGGITGRPPAVALTMPDAFGALAFLNTLPAVDKTRIGVMGFSWGGVVSMLAATNDYATKYAQNGQRFVAHVPHYPVCWVYNVAPTYNFKNLTGAPVLIQTGDLDAYNPPSVCANLIASLSPANQKLVDLNAYPDSTHGFDRLEPPMVVTDPTSHQGAGGLVQFTPNPRQARKAVRNAVKFFVKNLHVV